MKNLQLENKKFGTGVEVEQFDRDGELRIIAVDHTVSVEVYLKKDQIEKLIEYLEEQLENY